MSNNNDLLVNLKKEFAALQTLQKEEKNILNYLPNELKLAIQKGKGILRNNQAFLSENNATEDVKIYDDALVATDDVAAVFLQQQEEDAPGDEFKVLTGDNRTQLCAIAMERVSDWQERDILALEVAFKGDSIGSNIQNFMAGYAFGHKYRRLVVAAADKIYICTYNNIGSPAEVIETVEYSTEQKANVKFNLLQHMGGENDTMLLDAPDLPPNVTAEELVNTWSDLLNMKHEQAIYDVLNDVDGVAFIQDISEAKGLDVNLDYFSVNIDRLPNNISPAEFLTTFRTNINSFINGELSNFVPFDPERWVTDNFRAEIVHIDMGDTHAWYDGMFGGMIDGFLVDGNPWYNPDDGSVIVTLQEENRWVFTTIYIESDSENDYYHPVSGNREFGINANPDGSFTFYTAGVDRTTTVVDATTNDVINVVFSKADELWNSMLVETENFIDRETGDEDSATRNVPVTLRPSWENARNVLKK